MSIFRETMSGYIIITSCKCFAKETGSPLLNILTGLKNLNKERKINCMTFASTIHIHIIAYHKPEFMFSLVVETFNKAFGLREESPSQVMRLSSRDLFTIQRKSFNNARQNDKIF